jgi:hypothetical protein
VTWRDFQDCCRHCGKPLPAKRPGGNPRLYCDLRCKSAAQYALVKAARADALAARRCARCGGKIEGAYGCQKYCQPCRPKAYREARRRRLDKRHDDSSLSRLMSRPEERHEQKPPDVVAWLAERWHTPLLQGHAAAAALIGINHEALAQQLARGQALAVERRRRESANVPRGYAPFHVFYNIVAERFRSYGFNVEAERWNALAITQWIPDNILAGPRHHDACITVTRGDGGKPIIAVIPDGKVKVEDDAVLIIPIGRMVHRLAATLYLSEHKQEQSLAVTRGTVSKDLAGIVSDGNNQPRAKTASNPKGAGRPKGKQANAFAEQHDVDWTIFGPLLLAELDELYLERNSVPLSEIKQAETRVFAAYLRERRKRVN